MRSAIDGRTIDLAILKQSRNTWGDLAVRGLPASIRQWLAIDDEVVPLGTKLVEHEANVREWPPCNIGWSAALELYNPRRGT
jgi:hypothetical protein